MSPFAKLMNHFVRAGTLDDPSAVEPDVHIYTRTKVPWVMLPAGARAFEVYYDTSSEWPAASLERLDAIRALRAERAAG